MIHYRAMDDGLMLTSCLHSGPVPLADALDPEGRPAWLETQSELPHGTVARVLRALCAAYGACGVVAVDGDLVVGKVRFAPGEALGPESMCVQQGPERLAALADAGFPRREDLADDSLTLLCLQVVDDPAYRGRGIGMGMVEAAVSWARGAGFASVRASATRHIRPVLDWTGMYSVDAYARLGFVATGEVAVPEPMLEGIRNMRAGYHGDEVRAQWGAYADLSDEQAAEVHDVVLRLR
jgi:GNAT superfamily N-acetyltransferase